MPNFIPRGNNGGFGVNNNPLNGTINNSTTDAIKKVADLIALKSINNTTSGLLNKNNPTIDLASNLASKFAKSDVAKSIPKATNLVKNSKLVKETVKEFPGLFEQAGEIAKQEIARLSDVTPVGKMTLHRIGKKIEAPIRYRERIIPQHIDADAFLMNHLEGDIDTAFIFKMVYRFIFLSGIATYLYFFDRIIDNINYRIDLFWNFILPRR